MQPNLSEDKTEGVYSLWWLFVDKIQDAHVAPSRIWPLVRHHVDCDCPHIKSD